MEAKQITLTYRRYALGLLLAVNLLNYIDRQVLFAVFPLIKDDLHLTDTALGFLGSAFMFSYMLFAPLFGWLGDRWSRTRLASGGLVVWSLATVMAGFAPGYRTLLAARATVGVGEAIPVGSTLGYLLGVVQDMSRVEG